MKKGYHCFGLLAASTCRPQRPRRSIRSSSAARWCAASAPALPASRRRTRKATTRGSTSIIAARWRRACSAMPPRCATSRSPRRTASPRCSRARSTYSTQLDADLSARRHARPAPGAGQFLRRPGFCGEEGRRREGPQGLNGATVCVAQGTTHEVTLGDYGRANGIDWKPLVFERIDTMYQAFFGGRCDAMTQDASALAGAVATAAPNAGRLCRAAADHQQGAARPLHAQRRRSLERHHHLAALWPGRGRGARRHRGQCRRDGEIRRRRRSSACSAASGDLGSRLGLDNKWMVQAIKAGGNYGEIFERNVGKASPLKLDRGLNATWSKGGLMYAHSVQVRSRRRRGVSTQPRRRQALSACASP